jgi:hypothetical protein
MTREEYLESYAYCCNTDKWTARYKYIRNLLNECDLSELIKNWEIILSWLQEEAGRDFPVTTSLPTPARRIEWINHHPINVLISQKIKELTLVAREEFREYSHPGCGYGLTSTLEIESGCYRIASDWLRSRAGDNYDSF